MFRKAQWDQWIIGALLSLSVFWVWRLGQQLQLEYFDTYTLYTNAWALARGDASNYNWTRAPFLSLLQSPFYGSPDAFTPEKIWHFSHALAAVFYTLWIGFAYRIVRLCAPRRTALAAAFFLALNPLVVHYAPFARDDIPAAVFCAAGFYFYLKAVKKNKCVYWGGAALAMAAAFSTRHVVLIPVFSTLVLDAVCRQRVYKGSALRFWLQQGMFWGLMLSLFFVIMAAAYERANMSSWVEAPRRVLEGMFKYYELNQVKKESVQENIYFLIHSMTGPVFAAALAGLLSTMRRKKSPERLLVFWLGFFLFFHSFISTNKEARYLFTLFIPVYYFSAQGISELLGCFKERFKPGAARLAAFFIGACFLALPLRNAAQAYQRFRDPIYTAGYVQQLSQAALELKAAKGRIYWAGLPYALHDQGPLFHPDDEYTYLYHVFGHSIMFHTGQEVKGFPQARRFLGVDPETKTQWGMALGLGDYLQDGDVLILNLEPKMYTARELPEILKPLLVARIQLMSFDPMKDSASEQGLRYREAATGQTLQFEMQAQAGYLIKGGGFAPGFYEIYFQNDQGQRMWQGMVRVGVQGFEFKKAEALPGRPMKIVLLTYSQIRPFPPLLNFKPQITEK